MSTASFTANTDDGPQLHCGNTTTTAFEIRKPSFGEVTRGWFPVVILPLLVVCLTPATWPKWAAMWLLCGAVYIGCKWLTWRRTPPLLFSPFSLGGGRVGDERECGALHGALTSPLSTIGLRDTQELPPEFQGRATIPPTPDRSPAQGKRCFESGKVALGETGVARAPMTRPIPFWQHAAYLLAWPGLDAAAFLKPRPNPRVLQPSPGEWVFATTKLILGTILFCMIPHTIPAGWNLLRGWTGMIGIVFLLHFGLFHLLSCVWRTAGIDAKPLMDWPIAATSVSDFWGRRWNRAFRDLTHRFLFRPLTRFIGPRWGLAAGFLFSGLVHELVITVPAGGGYGGPTVFFGIQAFAMMIERSADGRRIGLGRERSVAGWVFTVLVLLFPAGLLFPPVFVERIILPFMSAFGATSP